jgi:hypothetical protein
MIKVFESFDHLGMVDDGTEANRTSYLWNLGWSFGTQRYDYYQYAPSYMTGDTDVIVQPGVGRFGTPALRTRNGTLVVPPLSNRQCDTLVVGMAYGGNPLDWQWGTKNQNSWYYYPHCLTVDFRSGFLLNFRVKLTFNYDGYITVLCTTGDGTGYPAIATPEYIPVPNFAASYTFIEVYCNVTDFMNGRVKVAVNGKTYIDKGGIATAAYSTFGSDPYDVRAKFNGVTIFASGAADNLHLFDTIYVCDDQAGYQDDFLGDVHMKPCYPTGDGLKSEWMAVENSTVMSATGYHHEFVDDAIIYPGNEMTYLEADQDLTSELFTFPSDPIPPNSNLLAVNARTLVRNVASPGSPKANTIVPLFQIQGNPILETNSLAVRGAGWNYYFLDVYYPLVPGFAIPWAEYLLEQCQFGFLLRSPENMQSILDALLFDGIPTTANDYDDLIADGLGMLDDTTESAWTIEIDELFDITENPDDGVFLLSDGFGASDQPLGDLEGMRNICVGGTATASSTEYSGSLPALAFDGNTDGASIWCSAWVVGPWWLQYELANGQSEAPLGYWIYQHYGYGFYPTAWLFQAAKESGPWVTLDTVTPADQHDGWNWRPISTWNPNETYVKFRMYITTGSYSQYCRVIEMKIIVPREVPFQIEPLETADALGFGDEVSISTGVFKTNFEGLDGAAYWLEEAQSLVPVRQSNVEIDTSQFYSGVSSLLLPAKAVPSGVDYLVPGIPVIFTLTWSFRFHGIDDWFGLFMSDDSDDIGVFFDFALIKRSGTLYYWIGAGDATGEDIGTPFEDECLLAADEWHVVEVVVDGADVTVYVDEAEVAAWTASGPNPLLGLDYVEMWNANSVPGNDVWIDSILIR